MSFAANCAANATTLFIAPVFMTMLYCCRKQIFECLCVSRKCNKCQHTCHNKTDKPCSAALSREEIGELWPLKRDSFISNVKHYGCTHCSHVHQGKSCNESIPYQVREKRMKKCKEERVIRYDDEVYTETVVAGHNDEAYQEDEITGYDDVPYEETVYDKVIVGTRQVPHEVSVPKTVTKVVKEAYTASVPYTVHYTDYISNQRSRQVTRSRWDGSKFVNTYDTEYYTERLPVYKTRTEYKNETQYRNVSRSDIEYVTETQYKTESVFKDVPRVVTKIKQVPKYTKVNKVRQVPILKNVQKTRKKPIYEEYEVLKEVEEIVTKTKRCRCTTYQQKSHQCECKWCACDSCRIVPVTHESHPNFFACTLMIIVVSYIACFTVLGLCVGSVIT